MLVGIDKLFMCLVVESSVDQNWPGKWIFVWIFFLGNGSLLDRFCLVTFWSWKPLCNEIDQENGYPLNPLFLLEMAESLGLILSHHVMVFETFFEQDWTGQSMLTESLLFCGISISLLVWFCVSTLWSLKPLWDIIGHVDWYLLNLFFWSRFGHGKLCVTKFVTQVDTHLNFIFRNLQNFRDWYDSRVHVGFHTSELSCAISICNLTKIFKRIALLSTRRSFSVLVYVL